MRTEKKNYLQVYLEEYKYKIKRMQMSRFINAKLYSDSDDDSDDSNLYSVGDSYSDDSDDDSNNDSNNDSNK